MNVPSTRGGFGDGGGCVLREAQSETQEELDALLPSVLRRVDGLSPERDAARFESLLAVVFS